MEQKHRIYLKLNLMSVFFIAVSFISVTLAWFAYSGLAKVATEVNVKAWYIELEKSGQVVSNDIIISLSDIYPGMETVNEIVNVKNKGDSDAQVKYSIASARVLGKPEDNYKTDDVNTTSEYVEDILSHNYPFHINISLTENYIVSKTGESSFEVSISWPLDSDTDAEDSFWGTEAYKFQKSEEDKRALDPDYQIEPSIQVVISLTAEQYIETETSSDPNYDLGDIVLFNPISSSVCSEVGENCYKTYVIDVDNKISSDTVTLLPDPMNSYIKSGYDNYNLSFSNITSGWGVNTRPLLVGDILKAISTDVIHSVLKRDAISDSIIGNLNYDDRLNIEINKAISYNGYYSFHNDRFGYFSTASCYWTSSNYNLEKAFAIQKISDEYSKVYGEYKATECKVIPIIIANKSDL